VTYALSLFYNFSARIKANQGLDDHTAFLYKLALTFSALSFSVVFAKGKALFDCEGGSDDLAVLDGARKIAMVDELRLLFVDLPGYVLAWAATLRVLQSANSTLSGG
jgi:hypothetical protein